MRGICDKEMTTKRPTSTPGLLVTSKNHSPERKNLTHAFLLEEKYRRQVVSKTVSYVTKFKSLSTNLNMHFIFEVKVTLASNMKCIFKFVAEFGRPLWDITDFQANRSTQRLQNSEFRIQKR